MKKEVKALTMQRRQAAEKLTKKTTEQDQESQVPPADEKAIRTTEGRMMKKLKVASLLP